MDTPNATCNEYKQNINRNDIKTGQTDVNQEVYLESKLKENSVVNHKNQRGMKQEDAKFNKNTEKELYRKKTGDRHSGLNNMKEDVGEPTRTGVSNDMKNELKNTSDLSRKEFCDNCEKFESVFDDLWNADDDWEIDKEDKPLKDTLTSEKPIKSMKDVKEPSIDVDIKVEYTEKSSNEENVKAKLVSSNEDNSDNSIWGGWENWGVPSILSTASQSVSTLTNSVSQGISTVLESTKNISDTNESTKLSQTDNLTDLKEYENNDSSGFKLGNLSGLVSGVSKLVESTGMKVITGGLDTLETIGKKTMEVLQEGDPGLKKKQALLKLEQKKPILSDILKEAKEKAEIENQLLHEKRIVKNINYENLLDNYQGLVHFEALQILSKQCNIKLQTLTESYTDEVLIEFQETIDQVKELCELPDEAEDELISLEEIKVKLKSVGHEINVDLPYNNLLTICEETEGWLNNLQLNKCGERELHQKAIETLAQLTAITLGLFHKTGELLLLKTHHNTADEADCLVRLTTTLTSLLEIVAAKFSEKLNVKVLEGSNKESVNSLITNVFYEAANSTSHIQDAFQLLVPILQLGAVGVV